MGDHRIGWTIEAEFHGVKRKCGPAWLNFASTECEGVDDRVIEFFRELYAAGMEKYDRQVAAYHAEQAKAETERAEREELARLKAKYEQGDGGSDVR